MNVFWLSYSGILEQALSILKIYSLLNILHIDSLIVMQQTCVKENIYKKAPVLTKQNKTPQSI